MKLINKWKIVLPVVCATLLLLLPLQVRAEDMGLPDCVGDYEYYMITKENDGVIRCYLSDYLMYVYGSDTDFSVYLAYGQFATSVFNESSMTWS